MSSSTRRGWVGSVCAAVLALAGCERLSELVSGSQPVPAHPPEQAAAAPPAPPAPPPSPQVQLLGKWCLRTMDSGGASPPVVDGSEWEFKPDGTYAYKGRVIQSGQWTFAPGKLTVTGIGPHDVVELSAERMVLQRMGIDHHFHRDCGPEVARARMAEKLRQTAASGDWMMVKAVLDDGADIDMPDPFDSKERNALMAAAERGHVQVVKELLDRGAKVTVFDVGGNSVFDYARKRIPEAVTLLALRLPAPSSPDLPVFRKMSASNECPNEYLKNMVCVHASALARPTLNDEYPAFVQNGESPTVASNPDLHSPEGQVAAVAVEPDFRADPARLDPGALSNADAERANAAATARANRASPSTRTSTRTSASSSGASTGLSAEEKQRWAEVDAEYEQYEQRGSPEIDPEVRRQWCAQLRTGIDDLRAGRRRGGLEGLGMSDSDVIASGEANYARSCP